MNEALTYYTQHGPVTDPGPCAGLFQDLPASLPDLVALVQNLTVHVYWASRCGLQIPPDRMGELQLRTVRRRLERTLALDGRALAAPRPLEKKLVGNCRDFSVLLAALLRSRGVPARARCGFGTYFLPDHFEDHWVAEYWDLEQSRWALVDAQLDDLQRQVLGIDFDPLDVPRDRFITGGKAWQMCRAGEHDPDKFGISDLHGLWFVRGDLVRDVAALNKVELLPWDCWGILLNEKLDDPGDLQALDEIAALAAGDVPDPEAVRLRYRSDARLRMDGSLLSFVNGQMIQEQIDLSTC